MKSIVLMHRIIAMLLLTVFSIISSNAAEISIEAPNERLPSERYIFIRGEIKHGDFTKIEGMLKNIFEKYYKFKDEIKKAKDEAGEDGDWSVQPLDYKYHPPRGIVLESNGGSVLEAMKIGRLAREFLFATSVNTDCASSCLLIFAGGVERSEAFYYGKTKWGDVGPRLGFHRPHYDEMSGFSKLPAKDAAKQYKTLLKYIESYLSEMDASQEFIDLMFSTASDDITWVAVLDALNSSIITKTPKGYYEWMRANCNIMSDKEENNYLMYGVRDIEGYLTEYGKRRVDAYSDDYIDKLKIKSTEGWSCEWEIEQKARREAVSNYFK